MTSERISLSLSSSYEGGEISLSYDPSSKAFFLAQSDACLFREDPGAIEAAIAPGRVSEALDLAERLPSSFLQRRPRMSPTFQKVVLFALFLPLLERKSVDLKTTPIAIEAESPSLFSALFDLLRLEDQPRREGELASFYEAKRMWKEAGEDPEEILSLLFESLRSLPERYRVRDVKRAGLLCLLSIYADGILQGMSALPKGGAGAKGYLSSRSPLSLEKGRIRFDAPDRSIEKNAFTSWLSNTSFGKILAGELKSESLEDLLSELETEGWIERRGGALFLTPKGLALSAFSIPRMLRLS